MKCSRVDATAAAAAAEAEAYHKTARALLTKLGFDPDNLNKECLVDRRYITPMNYFCCTGNLTMCQYVVSRGADWRTMNKDGWYGSLCFTPQQMVKWRSVSSSCITVVHTKIRRVTRRGSSSLREALRYYVKNENFDIVPWCILHGALAPP